MRQLATEKLFTRFTHRTFGMLRANFSLKCISIYHTCCPSTYIHPFSFVSQKYFSKVVKFDDDWSIITSYNIFVAHTSRIIIIIISRATKFYCRYFFGVTQQGEIYLRFNQQHLTQSFC